MVSGYGNAHKDPWGEKRIKSTYIDHAVVGAFLFDPSRAHSAELVYLICATESWRHFSGSLVFLKAMQWGEKNCFKQSLVLKEA